MWSFFITLALYMTGSAATAAVLEHVVRSRVAALPHVELRDDTEVRGLCVDAGRVTGVELRNGGREHADLVVDAGGRNSHLPAWLRAAGLPSPDEQVVDARIGYASRLYRADRSWFAGTGLFILTTPHTPTGASVLPVEDGRWLVTAVGIGEHRPPRDEPGFHTFLTELRDPAVADFATRATPAGPISWHRRTANHRRHYERTRPWPRGLTVLGDALCAFNPIYGHGITVAALQALELRAELSSTHPPTSDAECCSESPAAPPCPGPSPPASQCPDSGRSPPTRRRPRCPPSCAP